VARSENALPSPLPHIPPHPLSRTLILTKQELPVPSLSLSSHHIPIHISPTSTNPPLTKPAVTIRLSPLPNTPSLRQPRFKCSSNQRFEAIVRFLRRKLALKEHEGVFCYVNSVFAPGLDEGVGNRWRVSLFFFLGGLWFWIWDVGWGGEMGLGVLVLGMMMMC
jgi:hypothetical protein